MSKAAADDFGPMLEATELAARAAGELLDRVGHDRFHRLLDHGVATLLGVELRGVGGQETVGEIPSMRPEKRLGTPRAVLPARFF